MVEIFGGLFFRESALFGHFMESKITPCSSPFLLEGNMRPICPIWNYLYNLKDLKNIHGELLLLVKLQAEATSSLFWTITKCCENTLDWNFLVDLVTWIERDKGMVSIILLFFLFISYNCLLLTHSVPITTLFISVLPCIMLQALQITGKHSLHREWSLPLRISSFFCAVIHHYIIY